MFQICPQHSDEDVQGEPLENGAWRFRCDRRGHILSGPIEWLHVEPPPGLGDGDGICAEYNLYAELKEAIASVASDKWVEYGLIERAYAERQPDDFTALVARYGHTSIKGKRYTVSALLGGALGRLTSRGDVYFRWEPATQYWRYNSRIGWVAQLCRPGMGEPGVLRFHGGLRRAVLRPGCPAPPVVRRQGLVAQPSEWTRW